MIDTHLSVGITKLFVRPISKVLAEGSGVVNDSAGYKSMAESKWLTLVGSTLALASSTGLYLVMALQFAWGGPDGELWKNKWLNAFVLGVNLNSILGTIGMIFVCGVLKTSHISSIRQRTPRDQPAVSPGRPTARQTEFQANSQASSNYAPDELQQSVVHAEEERIPTITMPASTTQISSTAPLTIALPGHQDVVGGSLTQVPSAWGV
jgi:hypothetical protein